MQMTECISTSNATVKCVMPQLDPTYYGEPGSILTYSLLFGNYVVNGIGSVAISVQPNPTFGENSLHKTDINEGEVNPLLEIEVGWVICQLLGVHAMAGCVILLSFRGKT